MLETPKQLFDLIEWEEKYKPIQNHLDDNASFDGTMFETFGEEVEFVRSQDPRHVWTYGECDGKFYIDAGWHFVNRIGYFITENPYDDENQQVKLSADGIETEIGEYLDISNSACDIYENVMEALQPAEEMGGVEDTAEYIELMTAIKNVIERRIANAVLNSDPATLRAYIQSS